MSSGMEFSVILEKLKTTDILFGPVYLNCVLLILNLLQVFGSIVLVSVLDKPFDISIAWFFVVDGARVLVNAVLRIESLLKEAATQRQFIRKALVFSNCLGFVLGLSVFVYIFTLINKKDAFVFEIVAAGIVAVHFVSTIPALVTLFREPAETDHLLGQYQGLEEDAQVLEAPRNVSGYEQQYHPPVHGGDMFMNGAQGGDMFMNGAVDVEQQQLLYALIQQQNQRQFQDRNIMANQDLDFEQLEEQALLAQFERQEITTGTGAVEQSNVDDTNEIEPTKVDIKSPVEPPSEPAKSDNTVLLRIRLKNTTLKRRFLKTATIQDVHVYLDYEMHRLDVGMQNYHIVTTVPRRTVFDNLDYTLEQVKLYEKSSRECVSPILHVEDF